MKTGEHSSAKRADRLPPLSGEEPSPAGSESTEDPLALQFRHHAGKMSRQASIFFAGTIFTVLVGYLFKIYVARVLGAEQLGLYALGMRIVGFLGLFVCLGLPISSARFISTWASDQPERIASFWRRGLALVVAAAGSAGVALFLLRTQVATGLFGEPGLGRILPLFAILLPVAAITNFLAGYLRGHQQVAHSAVIGNFVQVPSKVAITVLLFAAGWGLQGYIAAEIGSTLIALTLMMVVARRLTPRSVALAAPRLGHEVSIFAASMVGMALLGFLSSQADQLLVGYFLDARHVGIYSVVVVTGAFVPMVLTSLNSIFGPIISSLHNRGESRLLERLFQTTTKWCLGLTWPLVVVLVLFAPSMMRIFGPDFVPGWPALAIVATAQLVNVGVGSAGTLLVMSGNQRREIMIAATTALVTIVLDLILIPRWGVVGAAAAMAAGISISNLMRVAMVVRFMRLVPYNRRALWLAIPGTVSLLIAVAVQLWSSSHAWPYWQGPLVAFLLAYAGFVSVAAASSLDDDDRLIIRAGIRNLRRLAG